MDDSDVLPTTSWSKYGTIAAIVTSLGGGPFIVGIVRVLDPAASAVVRRVFRPARGSAWCPMSHFVEYGFALGRDDTVVNNNVMDRQLDPTSVKEIHYDTTGPDICEDTLGQVDIFVMGIGSRGTVTGVGRYLKAMNPNVKIYGVEPAESNILNSGKPGPHAITSLLVVGFRPDILDMNLMEKVLEASV
ncbi:bifunctional L-3-cyanoalanine synthase/cysteine synthase 2, mitochondrial [Iris pallida]|uniref:Bifunctional L-3-cyanoalanine synthase/cysteine synthase 2, mitochondrial n=1 Tax=Iris pallida TaxID=29817 RepID=A0AAX6G3Y3_IRIPA|nr:bifunctional L-3-cyanoalanine synthase/cysteine synthase 2, mitochondrial [Iris pallida]